MDDFTKKYWQELLNDEALNHKRAIINGVHYIINDIDNRVPTTKQNHKLLGMSGRTFTIKLKCGKIIQTNDLWHQGEIPEEFKDQFINNAEFIND